MNDFLVKTVWVVTYFICWPITRLIRPMRISIDGLDFKNGQKPPLILISNHKSIFDPWILSSAIPFRTFLKILPIRILGIVDGYSNPMLRTLNRLGVIKFVYLIYGVIGFRKSWTFEEKTAPMVESLQHGDTVMIFPEGKLQGDEIIGAFKRGVAYLYNKTGAKILPAAIHYNYNGHGNSAVHIGKPTVIPKRIHEHEHDDACAFEESNNFLRRKVLSLYRVR